MILNDDNDITTWDIFWLTPSPQVKFSHANKKQGRGAAKSKNVEKERREELDS